jgi:energy-converting hydrogenase Eha subunit E
MWLVVVVVSICCSLNYLLFNNAFSLLGYIAPNIFMIEEL